MGNVRAVSTKLWGWVDIVHSEDDGGWYAHRWDRRDGEIHDLATRIFPNQTSVLKALKNPKLRWERYE
jgi:hypothetical protein